MKAWKRKAVGWLEPGGEMDLLALVEGSIVP